MNNRESNEVNYIDFMNKIIVINNYKTANNHGQRIIKLDEETSNILSKYYHGTRDGKPFLPEMSSQNFSTLLRKITNIDKPIQTLRQIY